jgi:hypothetical protein
LVDSCKPGQRVAQDFAVREQNCIQSLVLRGGCIAAFARHVIQECSDLGAVDVTRMTFTVKHDEAFYPMDVTLFGTQAEMLVPDRIPDLVEQPR